jgi:tetratricopeptide (TPR) repeat protein
MGAMAGSNCLRASLDSLHFAAIRFSLAALLLFLICVASVAQSGSGAASNDEIQRIYEQARAAESLSDIPAAIAKYERLLQIAPHLAPAYNNLGALYLGQREFQKAAEVLQKGLKLNPRMSSAAALLGIAQYEMGEYAAARTRLEAAVRANSKDDNAELFLARDLMKLGELNLAASHLQSLASRQPQNQEIWYLLGKVHMQLSEQALAKLNDINPNTFWVHEISGEVMESMKNYDGALIEYKKAAEMAPKQPGTHYSLGNAYWYLANWSAAAGEFQAELLNDPSNCNAQWKIGDTLLQQHLQPEAALAYVDKALATCPELVDARVDRARALNRLDRNEEALKELQAAEKNNPEEPSIHFLLGQTLRTVGRTQEAKAEMEIFTKLEEAARAAKAERTRQVLENKTDASPNN